MYTTHTHFSFKLIALAMVFALQGMLMGNALPVFAAGYFDIEHAQGSYLNADGLDIVINNTVFEGLVEEGGLPAQFETSVALVMPSVASTYNVFYDYVSGDMCDALDIEALHAPFSYTGALTSFVLPEINGTNDFGAWSFMVTVTDGETVATGETCVFDVVFQAWQESSLSYATSGFFDEERYRITLNGQTPEANGVVLNEFLPKPNGVAYGFDFGTDSSDMPQGEWIELYNLGDDPVDVSGWYTRDATPGEGNKVVITASNTAPATTVIPGKGFLVVYMNKSILNNTGDTVRLFNSSDVLQDSYAYTSDFDYCLLEPTPTDTNDTIPSGVDGIDCNPPGSNVPDNKSYARIPDGTGAFVDPVPTPLVKNTLDESEGVQALENFESTRDLAQTEVVVAGASIDTQAPVVTVFGKNPAALPLGTTYGDLGATVTDNVNQNLGYTTSGEVDTSVPDVYTISYTAVDQAGNVGNAERIVVVYDPQAGEPDLSAYLTPEPDTSGDVESHESVSTTEDQPLSEQESEEEVVVNNREEDESHTETTTQTNTEEADDIEGDAEGSDEVETEEDSAPSDESGEEHTESEEFTENSEEDTESLEEEEENVLEDGSEEQVEDAEETEEVPEEDESTEEEIPLFREEEIPSTDITEDEVVTQEEEETVDPVQQETIIEETS